MIFVRDIFGLKPIEDKLDKAKFVSPDVLKTTLCLTPVILLLLTGTDSIDYRDLIWQLFL